MKNVSNLATTFATAILASLIIGGGVYAWHAFEVAQQTKQYTQAQRAIAELNGKIADLEYELQVARGQVPDDASSDDGGEEVGELLYVSWLNELESQPLLPGDYEGVTKNYLAGTISSGAYADQPLYLEERQEMGVRYSHYIIQNGVKVYDTNGAFRIAGISDIPEEIPFPLRETYKLKKSFIAGTLFDDTPKIRKIFTDPTLGDFYLAEQGGCLIVELPNHTAVAYDIILPFANGENGEIALSFNDGGSNEESYTFHAIGGCVAMCSYLAIVTDTTALKPTARLQIVGQTSNGEKMYGIKNTQDATLKALYEDKNTMAYYSDDWKQIPTNKYTYDQFIQYHPLLYWQDPLGRWVEFKNRRFIMAAEMCKPVIYLYPEKDTRMKVTVTPNGGFTHTEPQYENGWDIQATPEGMLTDVKTGKEYEYLFWEGIGLNYPPSETGWVVQREDIGAFIDEKLTYLGLRGRELNDFKTYWIDRLGEAPYYKISFLEKRKFDEIAPLNISIAPQRVIRIMMTAQALDAPVQIAPQELEPAAARTGFTVVEWGGVVLK